jgi:hypothetical protein
VAVFSVIPLFLFLGLPWLVAWIVKNHWAHQRYLKALELKAEANNRLLDRMGSDPAIVELLRSDAQRGLFDVPFQAPSASRSLPYTRMLTALQIGLILLSAGVAFMWASGTLPAPGNADPAHVHEMNRSANGFLVFGALGIALGIGSLLSAVAAFFVGRWWKQLNDDGASARGGH